LSPFKLAKGINEITRSKIANVTNLNNTFIVLETNNKEQSALLLENTQICDITVSVYPHSSLNFTKGVTKCHQLNFCTKQEIFTELYDQHVIDCRRVSIQRNDETINYKYLYPNIQQT